MTMHGWEIPDAFQPFQKGKNTTSLSYTDFTSLLTVNDISEFQGGGSLKETKAH